MRIYITYILLALISFVASAQKKPRVIINGGVEMGIMNTGKLGTGYNQSIKSTRLMADVAYRYNGANHIVAEAGFRYDSCAFVNTAHYMLPDNTGFDRFDSNGLIKMQSVLLGVGYRLAFGKNNFGVSFQTGITGQYLFNAARYTFIDNNNETILKASSLNIDELNIDYKPSKTTKNERFEYKLYDEINPFNLYSRTKIGLRFAIVNFSIGYEMPFFETFNRNAILSGLPGDNKNRSNDLRGLRFDSNALFLSLSLNFSFNELQSQISKIAITGNK